MSGSERNSFKTTNGAINLQNVKEQEAALPVPTGADHDGVSVTKTLERYPADRSVLCHSNNASSVGQNHPYAVDQADIKAQFAARGRFVITAVDCTHIVTKLPSHDENTSTVSISFHQCTDHLWRTHVSD